MKKYYVNSLLEGSRIEKDVFIVNTKTILSTKQGAPFLKLKLVDKTGIVDAVKWDIIDADKVHEDNYLQISGTVRNYNGEIQILIDAIHPAPEDIDPADFLPCSAYDLAQMLDELKSLLAQVQDAKLKKLISMFLEEEPYITLFSQCPAAKSNHHAYIGGLLEHTLSVVKLCEALCLLYPQADKDLLLTCAFLHDIGKIDEFEWNTSIKYSDYGHMVGHLVGGAMIVRDAIKEIEDFDDMTGTLIEHMILSHHDLPEFGSPKAPLCIEAFMLHMADDLDAKIAAIDKGIEESNTNGDKGTFTSKNIPMLSRRVFRGAKS